MNITKSIIAALVTGLLAVSQASAQDKGAIGVSMPTKDSARWISDGNSMVKSLADKGYKADLQFADDDIPNQLAQIENMITKGVKVLVIAAIDGTTLSDALQKAADKGIKVVSYDRLIVGSRPVHTELEATLAQWKHAESAVSSHASALAGAQSALVAAREQATTNRSLTDGVAAASVAGACISWLKFVGVNHEEPNRPCEERLATTCRT